MTRIELLARHKHKPEEPPLPKWPLKLLGVSLGLLILLWGFQSLGEVGDWTSQRAFGPISVIIVGLLIVILPFVPFSRWVERHGVKKRKVAGMWVKKR